jgi:hypothetical protein
MVTIKTILVTVLQMLFAGLVNGRPTASAYQCHQTASQSIIWDFAVNAAAVISGSSLDNVFTSKPAKIINTSTLGTSVWMSASAAPLGILRMASA